MVSLLEPLVLYLFTFPHANVQVQGLRDSSWKKHIEDSTPLKVCMLSNFSFLNLYCFRMFMSQSNEWTNPSLHIYSLDPLKSKLGSCTCGIWVMSTGVSSGRWGDKYTWQNCDIIYVVFNTQRILMQNGHELSTQDFFFPL